MIIPNMLPFIVALRRCMAAVAIAVLPASAYFAADRARVDASRILLRVSEILSVAMLKSFAFLSFVS